MFDQEYKCTNYISKCPKEVGPLLGWNFEISDNDWPTT